MASRWRSGADLLAAAPALIAVLVLGLYVGLVRQQGEQPLAWVVAALAAAAILAGYGVVRTAPRRSWALAASGVLLAALGLLAILSIGLPILIAGGLALVAAARSRRRHSPAR
ncbi:hypothetical protein ONA91_16550 [Micromonospora sp. DR5-3]|uniref:hypothetical protein n=1 Tax=unclassified Micromonospora TaxID=2617518 RepID=UPI0011D7878D|nr:MULTISPECIES: hypothetical protein [unclassified Micromonospora]MCW3816053.1 hypothetical protein [Micromonospora sp. DR5-3]TYC21270.1 hypothetical protein FXF52_26735 [Micromonospora sp. MP36]